MWLKCPCTKGLSHVTCLSNHITCFKASVYRGLWSVMLYGYMFLRNSFLFSTETLHAGCEALGSEGRSPKLQGSEVPPPWVEGTGFKTLGDISYTP